MRLPRFLRPCIEIRLEAPENLFHVLSSNPLPFKGLPELLVDLLQPPVERLLVDFPGAGDVGHGHPGPQLDQQLVLLGQGLQGVVEGLTDPPVLDLYFLLLDLLIRQGIVGGLLLQHLGVDRGLPAGPGRELRPEIVQLSHGQPDPLVDPEDLARLVEGVLVANEELLQPDGQLPQPFRLGGGAPLAPEVVAEVQGQPLNDCREVRREAAAPLELPQHPVVVLDELLHDPGGEVLRVLPAEPGPPAGEGDDLLNERQALEEELVGGEVGRRIGGHRGFYVGCRPEGLALRGIVTQRGGAGGMGRPLNNHGEVRVGSLELPWNWRNRVFVFDELELNPGGNGLRTLPAEPGLPASVGEEVIEEREALGQEVSEGRMRIRKGGYICRYQNCLGS